MVKIVRTTNDNVASMFYEATSGQLEPGQISVSSLVMYQWIGFAVCLFSLLCSILLAQIHESVIDSSPHNEVKEKQKELKRQKNNDNEAGSVSDDNQVEDRDDTDGSKATIRQIINKKVALFMLINAFGYASVHAFYPNMSKFFQTRF